MKARRAARVKANSVIPVGFVGSSQSLTGDLVTLSPFGLFARTKRDVPSGTVLRVGITVGHEIFRATAVVRHSEAGEGFAVEFIKMTSNDRALLRRLYLQLSPAQG
ncbi:MAG: PilZ domain-containing protein [Acidobacteriia bacterium]|nr:PilZ domain-containing protein [Terriglobia bacterium]